jgi:DNA-directed RNA polymerase specialized sigma24 family protein
VNELAESEMLARIEAALQTLPPFTRAVFLAHRIDDLSYTEIAKATGTDVQRIELEMACAIRCVARAVYGQLLR